MLHGRKIFRPYGGFGGNKDFRQETRTGNDKFQGVLDCAKRMVVGAKNISPVWFGNTGDPG
jgi:hypothetical protein